MEIKFRVWDVENKKWYHSPQLVIRPYSGKVTDGATTPNVITTQYMGRKDKNGKEIYTGDILELIDSGGNKIKAVCKFGNRRLTTIHGTTIDVQCYYFEVDGRKTNPVVNNYCGKHDLEIMEIIGNVFENPELLEGNENAGD